MGAKCACKLAQNSLLFNILLFYQLPYKLLCPSLPSLHLYEIVVRQVQDFKQCIHRGSVRATVALQQNLHVTELAKVKVPLLLQGLHLKKEGGAR